MTPECKMGFGWIRSHPSFPVLTFKGNTIINPSSSKAEAMAILSALCTCSCNCTVDIYTDSQNCIDIFNSLFKNDKYRRTLKIKNHSIWTVIMQTVEKFHLKVILHKVKAHSNLTENDMADQLAKEGSHLPHPILINPKTFPTIAVPTWNDSLHINQDI